MASVLRSARSRRLGVLVACLLLVPLAPVFGQDGERERASDRVVHIEEGIVRPVPTVPRLCDGMDLEKTSVRLETCRLYCEQEGKGVPLVLVNGGPGQSHHGFHPAFSAARGFARVVYYDQRGCGLSDHAPGRAGYSLEQALDDLEGLRDALRIDAWVVLGHSYGGLLAQCYAAKYPERVKGLVLVCASSGVHGPPGSRMATYLSPEERNRIREIRSTPNLSLAETVYNSLLNGDWKRQNYYKPSREDMARIALYECVRDVSFPSVMSRDAANVDIGGFFRTCPIPTFVAEGQSDMTWGPDKPNQMREHHPNARFVLYGKSAHSPFADEPETFFADLSRFLAGLAPVPAAALDAWKEAVAKRKAAIAASPAYLLRNTGWGARSSQVIAKAYSETWLEELTDGSLLLKTGFALYDVKRYEEALAVFRRMQDRAAGHPLLSSQALIWQGHVLDLLGRRSEAVKAYQAVIDAGFEASWQHDQYRLPCDSVPYAKERLATPFTRRENQESD